MTVEQIKFLDMLTPLVIQVCTERNHNHISALTCISQACVESNYGRSKIMNNANALFGVKATKSWIEKAKYGGLIYSSKTKECYDGKTYTTITDSFRAYYSVIDSVRDYFDLIEMRRYSASLNTSNVKECITCIKNGGYATSPVYVNTVYNTYLSISKYVVPYFTNNQKMVIVNEVIAGKWGNGIDRRRRLINAGYDYFEIQKEVNNILLGRS